MTKACSMAYFPIEEFKKLETPFYYYDMDLLRRTLQTVAELSGKYGFFVHYAVKANYNPKILDVVREFGFGVDCVSGGEIEAALAAGFSGDAIMFAGVGKTDREIELALENNIRCFNVESLPELENINSIALRMNRMAHVAVRVNPNIDAHTHHYITTGLQENKFGISVELLDEFRGVRGVFGTNDADAVKMMNFFRENGVAVPGEIGVIGVDDGEICEHVTPRLDSIRQHAAVMGRKAAELLLERVRNGMGDDFVTIKIRGELVTRESVVSPGAAK